MSNQKPHLIFYKNEQEPHVVIFQNPDGSWGQDGELEMFLGLHRGKQKGSSSETDAYEQLLMEASYNEDKYEICRKALLDVRDMHKGATQRIDLALQQVKDVTGCQDHGATATTERVIIDVSDDGPSMNEVPHSPGRNKRTPYTRSRAAREGKRGRGL